MPSTRKLSHGDCYVVGTEVNLELVESVLSENARPGCDESEVVRLRGRMHQEKFAGGASMRN